MKSESGNDPG